VSLEEEMFQAAEELQFERAAELRDAIKEIRRELEERSGMAREPRTAPTPHRRGGRRR
jgi:excinuclease UvrABC nuclease subunit